MFGASRFGGSGSEVCEMITRHLRFGSGPIILICLVVNSRGQSVIDFDDISGQPHLSAFTSDRYQSKGVLFETIDGSPPRVWFCNCPSVQETPNGGAWSNPNAVSGPGAAVSIRARFVLPGSAVPTTVERVSVFFLSGPGADPLNTGISLVAFDATGLEIARATATTGVQFERLSVDVPGISSVIMEATSLLEVFDDFEWLTCGPANNLQGDADFNGHVNFADVTAVLSNFGASYSPGVGLGDANRNGAVDFADITGVLANFGETCL